MKGIPIKKHMYCKFWKLYTFGALFCDFQKNQNENDVYEGIQLLNDGQINFSGNYDKKIMKCNSMIIPPVVDTDKETAKTNIKETDEKEENNNNNNNEKTESDKNNDINVESSENKEININTEIPKTEKKQSTDLIPDENNPNEPSDNNKEKNPLPNQTGNVENKKTEKKKKNILGVSTGAALGISAGCAAVAAAGGFGIYRTLKGGSSGISHTRVPQSEVKSTQNKTTSSTTTKKRTLCTLITIGTTFFGIAGILIPLPILRVQRFDTYFNETTNFFQDNSDECYAQSWNNHGKYGQHRHWCGDPHRPPREGYDCPKDANDKNRCWFCKFGCAVSCFLRLNGQIPNEENIKNAVNDNADMDWIKFGYEYAKVPHDNCIGKFKEKSHFVHIIKVYEDDNKCDVYDPNGGVYTTMNLTDFSEFVIKKKKNKL